MLEHGGDLDEAVIRYGIDRARWLDLSTGITPYGYPVPTLDESVWHRLPSDRDGLMEAAAGYYGPVPLLPVPGSQAAISQLPRLWRDAAVGIVEPTYGEHAAAWQEAGHRVESMTADELTSLAGNYDIVVICNPNNPDGRQADPAMLETVRQDLASRGGWLIVDEAFADPQPEVSLLEQAGQPGLVILRSLGKFFGLAGARVGFVLGPHPLLRRLAQKQGPWSVPGPSRAVAAQALDDRAWQQDCRQRLAADSQRLHDLLEAHGLPPAGGTLLFRYIPHSAARRLQRQFAREAIWVRAFDEPAALRLGLPGSDAAWDQLTRALERIDTESD